MAGRLASILVTAIGAVAAFYATDVRTVFRLVIAIGTGPGMVLVLRWFWWRINAAAELAAMVAGFVLGLATTTVPQFSEVFADFGLRLFFISAVTAVIWMSAMFLTPPESDATLDRFYSLVRPGGNGWQKQRERTGVKPAHSLQLDSLRVIAASLLLFGAMFAIGGFLLLESITGWVSLFLAAIGGFWLRRLNKIALHSFPEGKAELAEGGPFH
jgi:hypothetical protein